ARGPGQPDGGVIELSTDDGATWTDIGTRATANGYNGTIVASSNPLHTRRGFTATNTGYPAYVNTTVNLGTTYRGRTIKIRFRGGADFAVTKAAGDIDDIAFTGLAVPPFHGRVAHRGLCGQIQDMTVPPPPVDMATPPDLASDACMPSISSYQLGRCNATAVYKNKLY